MSESVFRMSWWLQLLNRFQWVPSPAQHTTPTILQAYYRDLAIVDVFCLTRSSLPLNSDYFTWLLGTFSIFLLLGSFSGKHTHSKKVPLLFVAFCLQSFGQVLVNLTSALMISWGSTLSFRLKIWTIGMHVTKQVISLKNEFREVWLDRIFIKKTGIISINHFEIFLS